MNIWANAVITNKGLALQSKLIAGGTLTITKAVTGTGSVDEALLKEQSSVSGQKQTLKFRATAYPEPGKCAVTVSLNNDSLTTGYTAMQVGVYATDPDEGEVLYFIAQAEPGTGTAIPSVHEAPGYNAEWTFYFQYGQADNVSVTVDPANTISAAEAQKMVNDAVVSVEGNLMDRILSGEEILKAELSTKNATITLTTAGWTENGDGRYKQTVSVPGMVESHVVIVDVDLTTDDADAKIAYLEAWAYPAANEVDQGDGTLTFYSWEMPTVNIPVNVGVM